MPKTRAEVEKLLDQLNDCSADDLEGQDVDFKEWGRDDRAGLTKAVEWAVCMANGGGGTIVFGIADDMIGRANAVVGVPASIDVNRVRRAICDRTDPRITPVFDELEVPEGTGRVVAMHIHPGTPPHTDTSGKGLIRVGKDCLPLTGTMRRLISDTDCLASSPETTERTRKSERQIAKERVLSAIRLRTAGGNPLVNRDVRRITGFGRHQVYRLVRELVAEGQVQIDGHGRAAQYVYRDNLAGRP